jgi:uncharacterized protein (DUF433 family)
MHFKGNIFQDLKESKVLDKDGKVNALGPYGKMKLTGSDVTQYFRKNKVSDANVKKAVEVALDLSGADTVARKEIAKFYGKAMLKNKDVQKALQYANESVVNFEVNELSEELLNEKNLMPAIQKIVSDKGAAKVGGVMLDMFTASVIVKAYDAVNDNNKKKMEASNIQTLVKLAQKVMGMKEETVHEMNTKMPEKVRTQILTHMNRLMDLPYGSPAFKKEKKEMEALQKKYAIKKESVKESKMSDLFLDISQGMTAKEIAKEYPVSLQQAKEFLKDYYSQKKKPLKMGEVTEGKYAKYSDLLMKKAKLVAQGPVATKEVGDINKKIAAEIKKLGIKEGVMDDEPLKDKYPFQKKFSVESTFREMYEAELKEEMITYRVKGMQKPEEDKFNQSAKLMKLKITMDKGKKDTVIVMSGTKKKLRDFDAIARGKSSYGDPSAITHFDEK